VFSLVDLATPHPDLLVGTSTLDDAGVFRLSEDTALVQTVDFFTPIVDDPYAFGRIAAANALSDVYAMGGRPVTALNIVSYPISKLPPEILAQILQGGIDAVREAGAVLVGGHSIDDTDPKFGMAVTGICHPDRIWTNAGAQSGDALILTKPLGAGVMTTGIKRGLLSEADIVEITDVMATLNKSAAECGQKYEVHACTDITGFGLLGHGVEMARASGVHLEIAASRVPILPKAYELVAVGSVPGGTLRNQEHVKPFVQYSDSVPQDVRTLLADSITSGGLLMSIAQEHAMELLVDLHTHGLSWARMVGRVAEGHVGITVSDDFGQ
jgi:selenide, water dikinase